MAEVVIKVVTEPGVNAREIGEVYSYDGITWKDAINNCDYTGHGRVFLHCKDEDTAEYVMGLLEEDNKVSFYW